MKLYKLIDRIKEKHLKKINETEILRSYLEKIIPDQESTEIFLRVLKNQNKDTYDFFSVLNIPYHTRDNEWLAHYIARYIRSDYKKPENKRISLKTIEKFVQNDDVFKNKREQYENDVIRAEIKALIEECSPLTENPTKTQIKINRSLDSDETFREEIIRRGINYGIPPYAIEMSLEKNANLWRQQMMRVAHYNQFLRPLSNLQSNVPADECNEIFNEIALKRQDWINLRENEYYKNHQRIIDYLGLATPNMTADREKILKQTRAWVHEYNQITKPLFDHNNSEIVLSK